MSGLADWLSQWEHGACRWDVLVGSSPPRRNGFGLCHALFCHVMKLCWELVACGRRGLFECAEEMAMALHRDRTSTIAHLATVAIGLRFAQRRGKIKRVAYLQRVAGLHGIYRRPSHESSRRLAAVVSLSLTQARRRCSRLGANGSQGAR